MATSQGGKFETLARFGYAARGFVYCLIGALALLASLGAGGQTGGSRAAIASLLEQLFGRALLGVVAFGLLGFAAWRIAEPLTDADRLGHSRKALATRGAHLGSGLIYASMALFTANLALGRTRSADPEDEAARDWTAWLMGQPLGRCLVAGIGLGIVAAGLGFAFRAWRGDVTRHLTLGARVGRLGFGARGVVFLVIGGFLVLAALHSNSREVKGLGGALESLEAQPYGWALLGITAVGLIAFGLFGFVQARYRRIEAPSASQAKQAITEPLKRFR